MPFDVVNVEPVAAVPEITGAPVLDGITGSEYLTMTTPEPPVPPPEEAWLPPPPPPPPKPFTPETPFT